MADIFIRPEVVRFARSYNNQQVINSVLESSMADKEYHDAVTALNADDADGFIDNFFKAIHHRYDLDKPIARRFIRRKLNQLLGMKAEISALQEQLSQRNEFLMKLAAEYTLMGKDCEREGMVEAAIANYKKALELYPDSLIAKRKIKKLSKKKP